MQLSYFHKIGKGGLLVTTLFFLGSGVLFAQSQLDEVQQKIQERNSAIAELESELKEYQRELFNLGAKTNTLQNRLSEISLTERKVSTDVRLTEEKIKQAEFTIKNLGSDIRTKEELIDLNKQIIGDGLQRIREKDGVPLISLLFSDKRVFEVIDEVQQINQLREDLKERNLELQDTKVQLNSNIESESKKKSELLELRKGLIAKRAIVRDTKKEQAALLKETKNEQSAYAKIIEEKNKLKESFESELQSLESELEYILDPDKLPEPGDRVFSWPLEKVYITQRFGLTSSSAKLYGYRSGKNKGKHTGVDFRTNNDEVFAMADGRVIATGNTDKTCPRASFGGWVLIEYNNGFASIYSHLSKITAEAGQRVSRGDTVAYSGNTGYSTGPHLDVKVIPADSVSIQTWPSKACSGKNYTTPIVAGGIYFNPLDYLPKTKKSMFKPGA
jgi:murein DD-endopeptidase MepM/ murein hydrolase activator NlpD